jgi:hypothetical protein
MPAKLGWLGVLGVVVLGGLSLAWQYRTQTQLQRQIGDLRQQQAGVARQRQENQRLAATLPTAADLERLRADHAAIPRLRAEIETLRARAQTAVAEVKASARFDAGSKVPFGEWRNAGTATSKAALETVLWAAAGGDIEQFAKCLSLPEGPARQRALKLLESLPTSVRGQYGTPERLVAFFAIKDVPLGTAQVVGWIGVKDAQSSSAQVQVHLSAPDGPTKALHLRFTQQDENWKLVVPEAALAKYSAMLKKPTAAKAGTK